MCNGARVAHSSCLRTSPEGGKPLEPRHHPDQHPRKNVQHHPGPDRPHHQQTPLRPTTVAPGRTPPPHHQQPPRPPRPGPARTARHTAEHFAQKVTDCTQSDLDSSPSTQNVTLCTRRPHTSPSPTRPGALGASPLAHVEGDSHPHDQEPRPPKTDPTPRKPQVNPTDPIQPELHPTHTTNTTPTNKYRSRDKQVPFSRRREGRGGRSRASASSRLLLCPGTPGQQPRSLPL